LTSQSVEILGELVCREACPGPEQWRHGLEWDFVSELVELSWTHAARPRRVSNMPM